MVCSFINAGRASYIRDMQQGPYIVGVAGGSGSGKTTLIRALRDLLPAGSVCLVSQDDYYHPLHQQLKDENGEVNFDLPTSVDLDLLAGDLRALAQGGTLHREEYTFNQPHMAAGIRVVAPAPIILVEGLFVLHHAPISEQFHLKVFVDASEEVQLKRRLARDSAERGYGPDAVRYQWENHVMPAYRSYLLPYRSTCDLHVDNGSSFDRALTALHAHLGPKATVREPARLQAV
jgi:uridine kinase